MADAILAVRRLELEPEVARRVDARHGHARRTAHAGVRRAQLTDHRVGDVVDVFVRARVLDERRIPRVHRRPILAVHLRIVVAVLHHAVRFVENLLPFVASIDAHAERKGHRITGTSRTSAARRSARRLQHHHRHRRHRRRQRRSSNARSGSRLPPRHHRVPRRRRRIVRVGRAHGTAEIDRATIGRRLHSGERARCDATTIATVDAHRIQTGLRVVGRAHRRDHHVRHRHDRHRRHRPSRTPCVRRATGRTRRCRRRA